MSFDVVKRDGRVEPFDREKIVESCMNSGAPGDVAEEIALKVESSVEGTTSSQKLKDMVLVELGRRDQEWVEDWLDYERSEKGITNKYPTARLFHNAQRYNAEIELPGVNKENIDLEMTERSLCLTAVKESVNYCGCWTLVHTVNLDEVEADFENGLLSVTMPLAEKIEGRKIGIE